MQLSTVRAIAIGVIIAALGLTATVVYHRSQQRAASDIIVERWDRLGGQEWLQPNLRGARVVVPDRPHSLQEVQSWRRGESDTIHRTRTFTIDTNSDRLRGDEVGPKSAGTTRIIALGDSVTHGWGVPEAASYPAQLEAQLRSRGVDVQVLNAGVPANPIPVMADWCRNVAPDLAPDIILWTRRPPLHVSNPYKGYVGSVRQCAQVTGARIVVVLPPVATFDVRGSLAWADERERLRALLAQDDIPVLEITEAFRLAQAGRGETMEQRGQQLRVVDQETGRTWLEVARSHHDLPTEVYDLFEREPAVREALFFDEGHPDAEGCALMAEVIADFLLQGPLSSPG